MHIMESSCSRGSVDLDSLTNFPQVIMPPKFKSLEFVKYDGIGDPCAYLCMFCRNIAPYRDNQPLLCQVFPNSLTGFVAMWYLRLEKTLSQRQMANAFLDYYRFNTEITPDRIALQRAEKKSKESFHDYAQRWHKLFVPVLLEKYIFVSHTNHMQRKINGSTSFAIDNMHYVSFKI